MIVKQNMLLSLIIIMCIPNEPESRKPYLSRDLIDMEVRMHTKSKKSIPSTNLLANKPEGTKNRDFSTDGRKNKTPKPWAAKSPLLKVNINSRCAYEFERRKRRNRKNDSVTISYTYPWLYGNSYQYILLKR